jgi:hypothetical protein
LAIANDEAYWEPPFDGISSWRHLVVNGKKFEWHWEKGAVCIDGILVCGKLGRENRVHHVGTHYSNVIDLGEDSFVLDIRGSLKPPLTPARAPPRDLGNRQRQWDKLHFLANLAQGRLWEKIASSFGRESDFEIFWQLAAIHQADIRSMRLGKFGLLSQSQSSMMAKRLNGGRFLQ